MEQVYGGGVSSVMISRRLEEALRRAFRRSRPGGSVQGRGSDANISFTFLYTFPELLLADEQYRYVVDVCIYIYTSK